MRPHLIALALGALGSPAFAQESDEPPPPPEVKEAGEPEGERVVLPTKRLYAQAAIEINLSKESAGKPFSLSPDVYYGVNRDLTVGLIHSARGSTGFIGGVGTSLCFTSACDVYSNVGLEGRYHLKSGNVSAAASFGLFAGDFDPFRLALKLGAIGRYRPSPTSKLAVDFAPSLVFGLTEREPVMMDAAGNKEVFAVPVTVLYTVTPQIVAMGQLGLILPFENAGDLYAVPFSLGASYAVDKQLSVDAAFSLPALLGGGEANGFDVRSFTIGGGYAF